MRLSSLRRLALPDRPVLVLLELEAERTWRFSELNSGLRLELEQEVERDGKCSRPSPPAGRSTLDRGEMALKTFCRAVMVLRRFL